MDGDLLFYTFILLFISPFAVWWYLREKRKDENKEFANHVADVLYKAYLEPIEKKAYYKDQDMEGSKPFLVLDENLMRTLFVYVDEARFLLRAFEGKKWYNFLESTGYSDKLTSGAEITKGEDRIIERAWRNLERNPKYNLWKALEDRFINEKFDSLTGRDLYNPFAYWIKELYMWTGSALTTADIREVQICQHGEIAFVTPHKIYNKRTKSGQFYCDECSEPRDTILIHPPQNSPDLCEEPDENCERCDHTK